MERRFEQKKKDNLESGLDYSLQHNYRKSKGESCFLDPESNPDLVDKYQIF